MLLSVLCRLRGLLHNAHPWPESPRVILQKSFTLSEQQFIVIEECRETFVIMCIYNFSARLVFEMTIECLAELTFHHSSINYPVELAADWWLFSHLEALFHTDFTDVFFQFAWSKSLEIKYIHSFCETAHLSAFKRQKTKIKFLGIKI